MTKEEITDPLLHATIGICIRMSTEELRVLEQVKHDVKAFSSSTDLSASNTKLMDKVVLLLSRLGANQIPKESAAYSMSGIASIKRT